MENKSLLKTLVIGFGIGFFANEVANKIKEIQRRVSCVEDKEFRYRNVEDDMKTLSIRITNLENNKFDNLIKTDGSNG